MAASSFTGSYRFDGGTTDAPVAARATLHWQDGGVVLEGDGLATNGHVIVANAALYNKQELGERLGVPARTTDAGYILEAYLRFGEDCLDHLIGDFAFAIWDPVRAVLFCARDHFGVEPFHYALNDRTFVFAGDLNLIPPEFKSHIDERVVGDFLLGHVADTTSCFYRDIARLPPAHCAIVGREGMTMRRYWRLSAGPGPSGRDSAERFRELFETAVRSRLDGADDIGILLSGGLDSSSIACTARRMTDSALPTFSLVYEGDSRRSEQRFIDAVLAQGGFDATIITGDDQPPFDHFDALLAEQDGPFLAPHLAGIRRVFAAARANGASVLLDGHGGDEVVSHGYARLDELAKARAWRRLWRELRAADTTVGGRLSLFLDLVQRHAGSSLGGLAARIDNILPGDPASSRPGRFIDRDFAGRIGLRDRALGYAGMGGDATPQERHIAMLESSMQTHAFEVLHRLNRATGLTSRYPFWDKRLVEFCLSVPVEQQLDDGWSRLILRRAMAGILPQAVQQRRDKFDFTGALVTGILTHHRALIDEMIGDASHPLFDFVDRTAAAEAFARLCAAPQSAGGATVQLLWRAIALGIWLDQRRSLHVAGSLARAA